MTVVMSYDKRISLGELYQFCVYLFTDSPSSTRILAEVLASGYKLGDQVLQKGIEIDNQHGFSTKFTRALQDFDKKTGKLFSPKEMYVEN